MIAIYFKDFKSRARWLYLYNRVVCELPRLALIAAQRLSDYKSTVWVWLWVSAVRCEREIYMPLKCIFSAQSAMKCVAFPLPFFTAARFLVVVVLPLFTWLWRQLAVPRQVGSHKSTKNSRLNCSHEQQVAK